MSHVHLFTDADNTLWHTDAVYARAQLGLLRAIETRLGAIAESDDRRALAFLRLIDQRIAETHPDNLRYPPSLLAEGISHALGGEDPIVAAERALRSPANGRTRYAEQVTEFLSQLGAIPRLRTGVRATLSEAIRRGTPVTVLTESSQNRCESVLSARGLKGLVTDVISARKGAGLYEFLRANHTAHKLLMIGDQLDRDIIPAQAAGFEAFYFPGSFRPYWHEKFSTEGYRTVHRYDQILPFLN